MGFAALSPSKQETQPLLAAPLSTCGQKPSDELSFAGFQENFHSAWSVVLNSFEALSGGWCSHQANSISTVGIGSFHTQLEFRATPGLPSSLSWYVQSVPPVDAAAQRGGGASPMTGFRAEDYEAALDAAPGVASAPGPAPAGGEALQQPPSRLAPVRGPGDRAMSPEEAGQALLAARCSMCSLKGNKTTSPNQDRGLCACLGRGGAGAELLAVLDGHGEGGHLVSEAACEVLPKLLLRALARANPTGSAPLGPGQNPQDAAGSAAAEWWREAAIQAFEDMHAYLEASTSQYLATEESSVAMESNADRANSACSTALPMQGGRSAYPLIDARTSGTTATVALLLPSRRLLVAHVGDSRAVLGTRRRGIEGFFPWRAIEITRDHKPDLPDERLRIEEHGAQVVSVGCPPNTTHRVFTPHQGWPSINMSRSLGDLHAHSQGLSASAEVNLVEQLWDPASEDAMVILASDGVWDVIDAATAVELAAFHAQRGDEPAAALAQEAYERWARRGLQGAYSDDITAVVKLL